MLAAVLRDQGMAVDDKVPHRFYDDIREVSSLHWVLVIAFREDASRVRSGHTAYGNVDPAVPWLGPVSPGDLCQGVIAAKRKRACWSEAYLLRILSNWNAIALSLTC